MIDRTLSAPMFRSVGRLGSFPTGNQVLQKRAGYRELLRTFVLTETGAQLALDWDLDDAFAASQRNVATLYEYWAFLQLAKSVGRVCGADLSALVMERSSDGMSIGFPRGTTQPVDMGARRPWTEPDGGPLLQSGVPRLVAPRLVLDPRNAPRLLASVAPRRAWAWHRCR